ncbi:vascular endothelial growth factor receptor 2-like, partial [Paramuricea clavata]
MEATNVFNITNLTLDDEGKYTCKVCNKERTTSLYIHRGINAYLKAFIIKEPDETLYDINSKVKLICTFGKNKQKLSKNEQKLSKDYFELAWYKLASDGQREPKPLNVHESVDGPYLLLDPLTQEAEGTYECEVTRPIVNYYDFKLVRIKLKDRFRPKIHVRNYNSVFVRKETENFSLWYNVSSQPACKIAWWRSKDGVKYQLITQCLVDAQRCEKPDKGNLTITKTSFEIKDLKFPQDNLFYKLVAENDKWNDSKTFQIQVLAKPEIEVQEEMHMFKKGMIMIINCTLSKRVNPPEINYTWHSCDTVNCGKDIAKWKLESRSYSLRIDNQVKAEMKYRCIAINAAGKDESATITVYKLSGNFSTNVPTKSTASVKTLLSVVVPTGIITLIISVATCFVLYKRKKIYGGFYLFSYPPLPDYMETLDVNGNIQEQLQKLPFIAEWEFPRERISFISELGSGEFGVVWLAEAMGISAFRPRDILKGRKSRRRFSFFNRMTKTSSYVYCKEVTKVAVKRIKDNWDRSKLLDLQSELKILIHVGENENIVNILGACTK